MCFELRPTIRVFAALIYCPPSIESMESIHNLSPAKPTPLLVRIHPHRITGVDVAGAARVLFGAGGGAGGRAGGDADGQGAPGALGARRDKGELARGVARGARGGVVIDVVVVVVVRCPPSPLLVFPSLVLPLSLSVFLSMIQGCAGYGVVAMRDNGEPSRRESQKREVRFLPMRLCFLFAMSALSLCNVGAP